MKTKWIKCPACGHPKLVKIRDDTKLLNFPAYCKHCKKEVIITIEPMSRLMNA